MPIEYAASAAGGARTMAAAPARDGRTAKMFGLRAINGWRGPGAIAIALAHLALAIDLVSVRFVEPVAFLVDLFFVLSGLVIAQVYSRKLGKASAIPDYIIRRTGRIWPVQVATLAALVLYELFKLFLHLALGKTFGVPPFSSEGGNLLRAIPTNLLLVQSLGLHDRETWNFPSWSLSVEFVTYLSFAAFCLARPMWRHALSLVVIAASLAILAFVAPYHMRSTFDFGVFRCLAGFFAGTLCFEAATRWPRPRWPLPTVMELATLGLVGLWCSRAPNSGAGLAAPLVFTAAIIVFIDERGLVSKVFASRPFQFLAELSFSIYMVHALVLVGLHAVLHAYAQATHAQLFVFEPNPYLLHAGAQATVEVFHTTSVALKTAIVVGYSATVFAVALLAYRLVEVPGRAAFARLAERFGTRRTSVEPRRPAPVADPAGSSL